MFIAIIHKLARGLLTTTRVVLSTFSGVLRLASWQSIDSGARCTVRRTLRNLNIPPLYTHRLIVLVLKLVYNKIIYQ